MELLLGCVGGQVQQLPLLDVVADGLEPEEWPAFYEIYVVVDMILCAFFFLHFL